MGKTGLSGSWLLAAVRTYILLLRAPMGRLWCGAGEQSRKRATHHCCRTLREHDIMELLQRNTQTHEAPGDTSGTVRLQKPGQPPPTGPGPQKKTSSRETYFPTAAEKMDYSLLKLSSRTFNTIQVMTPWERKKSLETKHIQELVLSLNRPLVQLLLQQSSR